MNLLYKKEMDSDESESAFYHPHRDGKAKEIDFAH